MIFHGYVSLPEGMANNEAMNGQQWSIQIPLSFKVSRPSVATHESALMRPRRGAMGSSCFGSLGSKISAGSVLGFFAGEILR